MSAAHNTKQLQRALYYARRGWRVFPLHVPDGNGCSCHQGSACTSIGKHPLDHPEDLVNGVLDATADEALIERWWERWPGANIGLATGAVSGIFVLDIDPRHDGDDQLLQLTKQHGKLPDTPQVLTGGGGVHYYFRHPGFPVTNRAGKNGLAPGVDVKGEGGYVVAPNSLHPNGTYVWELSSHPEDVTLSDAPAWLLARLQQPASSARVTTTEKPVATIEQITSGGRNDTLTSFAGTMRRRGAETAVIEAALLKMNELQCKPPLEVDEVQRIARSIGRYAPSQVTEWRVGAKADEFTTIEPLYKIGTDPPHYIATVCGRELRLSHLDLIEFKRFKVQCITQLDFVPLFPNAKGDDGKPLSQQTTWEAEFLAPALANQEFRAEEAPEDAGEVGAAWQSVLLYFNEAWKSTDKADLARDRLVESEGQYLFPGRALRRWLNKNCPISLKANELWAVVRDHGGKSALVRVGKNVIRAWQVPIPDGYVTSEETSQ